MKKILFSIMFIVAVCMATGCGVVQVAPREAVGPDVYRISNWSTSRRILAETVKSASERCAAENKHYLFVKNIFQYGSKLGIDMISYELYFSCVEADDPRLKEGKPPQRPAEETMDQGERQPRLKISPAREEAKPEERPGRETVPPPEKGVPEKEKPPVAGPGKEVAAPVPETLAPAKDEEQEQQEKTPAVSEEQLRKGNPGMGEPEPLRKDGSPVNGEAGKKVRVIEEPLYK